jgi:hypothetical protein
MDILTQQKCGFIENPKVKAKMTVFSTCYPTDSCSFAVLYGLALITQVICAYGKFSKNIGGMGPQPK